MDYSEDNWNAIRDDFVRLYRDEGWTLREAMIEIASIHGFRPNEAQYKKRIAVWGLRKNLTFDEKQQLGELATRCIASNIPLPMRTSAGDLIPWQQIRRRYGREKIPLRFIPRASRTKQFTMGQNSGGTLLAFAIDKYPMTTYMYDFNHASPSATLLSKILYNAREWFNWCRQNPSSVESAGRAPFDIIDWHSGASTLLRLGDFEQATKLLSTGACALVTSVARPNPVLFVHLLGAACMMQYRECYRHNAELLRFLEQLCKGSLGETNPLTILCELLNRSDLNPFQSNSACQLLTEVVLATIIEYCLDQVQSYYQAYRGEVSSAPLLPWGHLLARQLGHENGSDPDAQARLERFYTKLNHIVTSGTSRRFDIAATIRLAYHLNNQGCYEESCNILLEALNLFQGDEDLSERHALTVNLVLNLYITHQATLAQEFFREIFFVKLWDEQEHLILRKNTWLVIPALTNLAVILRYHQEIEKWKALCHYYPPLQALINDQNGQYTMFYMTHSKKASMLPNDERKTWPVLEPTETPSQQVKLMGLSHQQNININPYVGQFASFPSSCQLQTSDLEEPHEIFQISKIQRDPKCVLNLGRQDSPMIEVPAKQNAFRVDGISRQGADGAENGRSSRVKANRSGDSDRGSWSKGHAAPVPWAKSIPKLPKQLWEMAPTPGID